MSTASRVEANEMNLFALSLEKTVDCSDSEAGGKGCLPANTLQQHRSPINATHSHKIAKTRLRKNNILKSHRCGAIET